MQRKRFEQLILTLDMPATMVFFAVFIVVLYHIKMRSGFLLAALFAAFVLANLATKRLRAKEVRLSENQYASGASFSLDHLRRALLALLTIQSLCLGALLSYSVLLVSRQI